MQLFLSLKLVTEPEVSTCDGKKRIRILIQVMKKRPFLAIRIAFKGKTKLGEKSDCTSHFITCQKEALHSSIQSKSFKADVRSQSNYQKVTPMFSTTVPKTWVVIGYSCSTFRNKESITRRNSILI